MNWKIPRLTDSLRAMLGEEDTQNTQDIQLECIREDMLDLMSPYVESQVTRPPVWGAVLYAPDVQALWYQRTALMHLLAEHIGEQAAREKLNAITQMFRGHLPTAQFASARMRA